MHEGFKDSGIDIVNQQPEDQLNSYSRMFATALQMQYGGENTIAKGVTVLPQEQGVESPRSDDSVEENFLGNIKQFCGIEFHASDDDVFDPIGEEYQEKLKTLKGSV